MKMYFTLAAIAATLAGASVASAHENATGHWEWRSQPSIGPKSIAPSRIRVWVRDSEARVASCDCAMMKGDAAGCMMGMPGSASRPAG